MTDFRRDPLQAFLDLTVYAPIGAFFHGPKVIDELAERGRGQVDNARVIGKMAITKARQEAERVGETAQRRVTEAMVAAARAAGAPMAGAEAPDAPFADDPAEAADREPDRRSTPLHIVPNEHGNTETVPAVDLPIPDYDNLSASQVVPRLDDLADDELQAVRAYEQSHRGRMTILSRIAQLQAS